ncbi:citrate synthase [Cellvibrio sp.]|uniref:citrate synthase n=1 Tax=Cellvibrio sp. TaxID=1965322 RepID=UPI0039648460
MTDQAPFDEANSSSLDLSAPKRIKVQSRNEPFSKRASTRIWSEEPSSDNPYIAQAALCHGYDLFELMEKRSFVDVFYLLFRGELPSQAQAQLLQTLMVALINPGPRHPATRAAMNVGVGKTNPLHILPIASSVLGGEYLGGGEIENAMRFFRKYQHTDPAQLSELSARDEELLTPGFGRRHGGVDLLAKGIADRLVAMAGAGDALKWGNQFARLQELNGIGWFTTGIAAAVFADLGFQPKYGGALFQLLGAPGLIAHGMEVANKPITAMPYVSDDNYVLER